MGWTPPGGTDGGSTGLSSAGETAAVDESSTGTPDPDPTSVDPSGDETTGGTEPADCTPAWSTPFVGSPCASDGDCPFEGGQCILEDDGFPCGTCTTACDGLCPDQDGAPGTFCVDTADVGLSSGGTCLSRCDPGIVGGNGCRDGYACAVLDRFGEPPSSTGVCVPTEFAGGDAQSACQAELLELGAVFTPTSHAPESPEGFPNLLCEIEDPVLLYGPINGVGLEYIDGSDGPVRVGCETAMSIVGSAAVAQSLGVETMVHIGAYNCRTISGSSNLSQHGLGRALDIWGFVLASGEEFTVLDDWEDGNPNPGTPGGQLLRGFTDQVWMMSLWNIILTPEFNAAHDDHFHVDTTPGGNTYD